MIKKDKQKKAVVNGMKRIHQKKIQAVLVFVSLLWIVLGIRQGDYRENWMKAVTLCLECIGIG